MVALNRIYTRTGDDGTTGLVGNERRSKADARIEAIGSVDETNAAIGMARQLVAAADAFDAVLGRIQNDMFDLGADLATPAASEDPTASLRITDAQTAWLESEIDRFNAELEPLRSFVIPGGSHLAASLHFARTLARRAERAVIRVIEISGEDVGDPVVRYLNRLSDLLFVLARSANDRGTADVLWVPGQHR